jgi:hypothetical protein
MNLNPSYTKAPWLQGPTSDQWIDVVGEPDRLIARVSMAPGAEEALANLRLIQTAPELFDALKGMLAWNGTLFAPPPESWSAGGIAVNLKARAALAKAVCLE